VGGPWDQAANAAPAAPGESALDDEIVDLSSPLPDVGPTGQGPAAQEEEFVDLRQDPSHDAGHPGGER
jgi:hypothetical protein